jgi:hypothetical protein
MCRTEKLWSVRHWLSNKHGCHWATGLNGSEKTYLEVSVLLWHDAMSPNMRNKLPSGVVSQPKRIETSATSLLYLKPHITYLKSSWDGSHFLALKEVESWQFKLCLLYLLIQIMQLLYECLCPRLKQGNTFTVYLFMDSSVKLWFNH